MTRAQIDATGSEIGRRLALQAFTRSPAARPILRVRLDAVPLPERRRAG